MRRYWSHDFHNPSAIYEEGRKANQAVGQARETVAKILGVKKTDIIFTSGGTEANNLALLGAYEKASEKIKHPHLVISSLEHSSISRTAEEIVRRGGELSVVEVDEAGQVSPDAVRDALRPNTFLVSVTLAHHETGALEPLARIGRVLKEREKSHEQSILLHTDASQAPNYIDITPARYHVDLLSLDGSKIYGPRGIGVLVARRSQLLRPMIQGGKQEHGLRAGTENTALIVGFARALAQVTQDRESEYRRVLDLKKYFIEELKTHLPHIEIISTIENALPNMIAIRLSQGILSEMVVLDLDNRGVAVSAGSACLNLESGADESLIRISLGRETRKSDVRRAVKILAQVL